MKITVLNGNARHGSTWHCKELFVRELSRLGGVELTEFTLPRDMPHFCNGCFACIYRGEDKCPHAGAVSPIAAALLEADLIVLTSPVYALDVSGGMKAMLDHLCYLWMSHRPNPAMFRKVGLTIVTTAGMGLKHTTKTMRDSLRFWGCSRIFSFKKAVAAMKWDDVSAKKKAQIEREAEATAKRIARAVGRAGRLRPPLFVRFLFGMMAGMQKKNDWNPLDRAHWQAQGWLEGKKPF